MWCRGNCPYKTRGCQMAASLAQLPVDHLPITEYDCAECQGLAEPSVETPNATVLRLAARAIEREQPQRLSQFRGRYALLAPGQVIEPKTPVPQVSYTREDFPCVHRKALETLRECVCSPCNGGRVEPVAFCELLKRECTVLTVPDCKDSKDNHQVETCLACDHRATEHVGPVSFVPRSIQYLTQNRHPAGSIWANRFKEQAAFLVCGGPSLKLTDLSLLNTRGVTVAAVNNAGAIVRPHLWFAGDGPHKFHQSIFADPMCAKFIELDKYARHTRVRIGTTEGGEPIWENGKNANEFPNVWAFDRSDDHWSPESFLAAQRPVWADGSHRTSMWFALRLLIDFGFRTIYLVGCDFQMTQAQPYGWEERKEPYGCDKNNELYKWLDSFAFPKVKPYLERQGIRLVNSTVGGNLNALERMPLADAVAEATAHIPKVESLLGHYGA